MCRDVNTKYYRSMFLRLALRRATMPSFANKSKENGSIPCIKEVTGIK